MFKILSKLQELTATGVRLRTKWFWVRVQLQSPKWVSESNFSPKKT